MKTERKRSTEPARLAQCAICAAAVAAICVGEGAQTEAVESVESLIPVHSIQRFEEAEAPETNENALIESALLERATCIENCKVTWYCPCEECNGNDWELARDGSKLVPNVTCAVDPEVIPLGSDVLVDFGGELQYYRACDTGSAITGAHVDICVGTHEEALRHGVQTAAVYWCK